MARQKKHKKKPHFQQKKATTPQTPIYSFVEQASPFLRLLPELRNHIYKLVLTNIDTLVVSSISINNHKTPPHQLSQTCRQLRAEFSNLYKQDCGKYASLIRFQISNFNCSGLDATLKRLRPSLVNRKYELNIHLDNNLQFGKKQVQQMIRTGGVFSQVSQGHVKKEDLDLVSEASISFCWDAFEFCLPSATQALDFWCAELLQARHDPLEYHRCGKVFEAFDVASEETEVLRNTVLDKIEDEVELLLRAVQPKLWVRFWLRRRLTWRNTFLVSVGFLVVVMLLVLYFFQGG